MTDPDDHVWTALGTTEEEYSGIPRVSEELAHPSEIFFVLNENTGVTLPLGEMEDESERHKDVVGVYHASATQCPRKSYYDEKDLVSKWDGFDSGVDMEKIFRRGDTVEDWVEKTLQEELPDKDVRNQLPVKFESEEFYVTGSTDPYILDGDELWALTEVKSTSNELEGLPKSHHVRQLNVYLSVADLDSGILIYVQVDEDFEEDEITIQDIAVLEIEQDDALFQRCLMAFSQYHDYRLNNTFPPAFPVDENECQSCEYYPLCKDDNEGDEYVKENFYDK